jgi:hypothetical protein
MNFHADILKRASLMRPEKVAVLALSFLFLGALTMAVLVGEKSEDRSMSGRDRYARYVQERAERDSAAVAASNRDRAEATMAKKAEAERLLVEVDRAMDAIARSEF